MEEAQDEGGKDWNRNLSAVWKEVVEKDEAGEAVREGEEDCNHSPHVA